MTITTCGHEVTEDSQHQIKVHGLTREGGEPIDHLTVCDECFEIYKADESLIPEDECEYCGGKIIDYGFEKECENSGTFLKKGSCTMPEPVIVDLEKSISEFDLETVRAAKEFCDKPTPETQGRLE